jgi:carboxylate-amine ligase
MRICDAQASGDDSTTLAALITSCVAQAALDHDEGAPFDDPPSRLLEENLWRAIRYGLDGKLIDLARAEEYPAAAARDRLLAWTTPARMALGIEVALPEENGAQRQKRQLAEGASIEDIYAAEVELTQRTYAAEEVTT